MAGRVWESMPNPHADESAYGFASPGLHRASGLPESPSEPPERATPPRKTPGGGRHLRKMDSNREMFESPEWLQKTDEQMIRSVDLASCDWRSRSVVASGIQGADTLIGGNRQALFNTLALCAAAGMFIILYYNYLLISIYFTPITWGIIISVPLRRIQAQVCTTPMLLHQSRGCPCQTAVPFRGCYVAAGLSQVAGARCGRC